MISYSDLKKIINNEGYELLTLESEYKKLHSKIKLKCSKNHEFFKRADAFKNMKQRCTICSNKARKKYSIEFIKNICKKEGYICLSTDYKNIFDMLSLICPNGHEIKMRMDGFILQGYRCKKCSDKEAGKKRSLEKHHWWKGGICREPYCFEFTNDLKHYIKDRDKNLCINPYCSKKSKKLHIHHIDYNKKNCDPSNLITICNSCNSKANEDREWHTKWYKTIINNRRYYRT